MNCLEFRRRLLINPMAPDPDLQAHESDCPGCATFGRDLRAKEVRLHNLLLDVRAPEGMAGRIQLATRFDLGATRLQRWWCAGAAAMLVAVTGSLLTLWTTSLEGTDIALAQSVFNHIDDEAHQLHEARPVPAEGVNYVLARFGERLIGDIGAVHFAAECLMRRRNGVHLVFPGETGTVTMLFMPGEPAETKQILSSARFEARIVPYRSLGAASPWSAS